MFYHIKYQIISINDDGKLRKSINNHRSVCPTHNKIIMPSRNESIYIREFDIFFFN